MFSYNNKTMAKYKITLSKKQRGKKIGKDKTLEIDCLIPPKIGEGRMLAVHPPIIETITKIEKI